MVAVFFLVYVLKVRELSPFASNLGFHVEEYAAGKGAIPPRRRRKKRVLYVATIEKVGSASDYYNPHKQIF